jgi:hypothetical protein
MDKERNEFRAPVCKRAFLGEADGKRNCFRLMGGRRRVDWCKQFSDEQADECRRFLT